MKKTAPATVIEVNRDHLSLCSMTHLEPLVFKFTSAMVSDLEIVSAAELTAALRGFIEANKIKPTSLVLILSQAVYFEKNYPGPNGPSSKEMDDFNDSVPFAATSYKLFKVISGYKQVVINRDFYECFKQAFEDLGFSVQAVVPAFALGQTANSQFTAETCRVIYRKMDQIIADSLIGPREVSLHQKEQVFLEKNKIMVFLIFFLVLGVLGVTAYFTLKKPLPRRAPAAIGPVSAYPTSAPIPTSEPLVSSPSARLLDTLTVQVLNSTGVSGQAASLSAVLNSAGFTRIQTGNSSQVTPRTLIIVSPLAATSAADFVTGIVAGFYPDYSLQHNDQAVYDITIIIGKTAP
jgi:hypothetical protein